MAQRKIEPKGKNGVAKAKAVKKKVVPKVRLEFAPEKPPYTPSVVPANATREEEIARAAYALWERRGNPLGSPDQDWYQAEALLTAPARL